MEEERKGCGTRPRCGTDWIKDPAFSETREGGQGVESLASRQGLERGFAWRP